MIKVATPALVLLLLAGCAATDPYRRPGMWQPTGAAAGNLAVMLENPHDLIRGRGETKPPPKRGIDPVLRLWDDRVKPFNGAGGAQPAGLLLPAAPGPAPAQPGGS
jgi:type IV pilus biogenesis protein CpaD/CtpE